MTLTSALSPTAEYIRDLPVVSSHSDYVVKIANARDLIANLPVPQNLNRNLSSIPPVAIEFRLSTSLKLPRHIARKVKTREEKAIFGDDDLAGLCMSGRKLPVKIFLHENFMMSADPSGELLEEVAFHEVIHGIEGIKEAAGGDFTRVKPWSYRLQQRMLALDKKEGKARKIHDSAYVDYLRRGTRLQQNVSEIFPRVAVANMYHIKETGRAMTSFQEIVNIAMEKEDFSNLSCKDRNVLDIVEACLTFSPKAQILLGRENDNMMRRAMEMYGCEMP